MPTTATPRKSPARKAAPRSTPTQPAATEDVTVLDPDIIEFEVEFANDDTDEVEIHSFRAKPRYGYKRMRDAALAQKKRGADLILMFERMITPSLLDHDGTPADWTPEFSTSGDFVDPDGTTRPVADLETVNGFDAGSSRRRFAYLMEERDELDPGIAELQRVYNLLIENAAGRPTGRSSSS